MLYVGLGFLETFLGHVHQLLADQDTYSVTHWVKADAAKASNMKQSETLRYVYTFNVIPWRNCLSTILVTDVEYPCMFMWDLSQWTGHVSGSCGSLLSMTHNSHKYSHSLFFGYSDIKCVVDDKSTEA